MKVIIVRHTESEGNIKGVYSGIKDYKLTDNGISQVNEIIDCMDSKYKEVFTHKLKVYTSPLCRCTEVTNRLKERYNCEIIEDKNLLEFNFGIFEDKTYREIMDKYKDESKKWFSDFINYEIPEGESLKDCYRRVQCFIDKVRVNNEDTVIITHGGIMKLIAIKLLNLTLEDYWKFYFGNGAILEIVYEDNFGYIKNLINNN